MKRLTIYFSTIFILAASPALATSNSNTNNYDELKQTITNCVTNAKKKSKKKPGNYITNRTEKIKDKKLTHPIKYDTQINLGTSDFNSKTWRCSIDAQPNDKIQDEIKVTPIGRLDRTTKPEAEERCINEILRKTAIDDWYVSECLSNRIKKKYNIETVDDYYTKIYQTNNEPDSESTNTESQQTDNGSQTTPTTNTNNNSASSKISVTVIDYYNNTGIKNITVCNNNNCKQSDKNGKVTFTATKDAPQTVSIQKSSEYHCDKPFDENSPLDELNTQLMEGMPTSSIKIENSQHQFVIKCRKLCTGEDLQKLNSGLKEQNKIKKCYKKSQRKYEITECKYSESKLDNNQCKLYSNDITIDGNGIDIDKVEISLGKNKSKLKPAAEKNAKGQTITIEDIYLDETKYISAKHGEQTITCEFKFRNNTICDFDLLNDDIIEEDVSSDIIIDSTSGNKLNDAENKNEQQEQLKEKQITKEEYEQIKSEINQILTDIKEQINSQCPLETTIEKCKNKDETIEQIEKAAKTTLSELNALGNN